MTWRAAGRLGAVNEQQRQASSAQALLASGPGLPLIISPKGSLDADPSLWERFGLKRAADKGELRALDESLAEKVAAIRASGATFTHMLRPRGTSRVFIVQGGPAPAPYAPGTLLLWFIDITESERKMEVLHGQNQRLSSTLDALSALIEAAPFPMWYRGPDLRLAMVNGAYVAAVEAPDALTAVQSGLELVDESDGKSPLSQAAAVREKGEAVARTVPATVAGQRRMMRVVELPLGETGVAGYAIDVEEREQARADLARFMRAQRDMLDRLSAGVVQFSRDRSLTFYNRPFARLFALPLDWLADRPEFDRLLDRMRENRQLPEVRDYPQWKEEHRAWFTSGMAAEEEDWLLPGGTHLRVVAQPLPDGGLLLIFEDRTEQLQLASARDTLLRVRTATFDNLFEAVGVFASDGRLQLWNNRFRQVWQLEEEELAAHPRIDALSTRLAKKLKNRSQGALIREMVRSATVERKQRTGQVQLTGGRDFEFAAVPLPDGNALFTMIDVTDSRMMEAALRERNEALVEADKLKTAFVSNMSYELRTPLTSIAGFTEMLANGYAGALPSAANDYVRAILDSVSRLSSLIDNVLDLTQSDSGSLLLAEDHVDLAAMCAASAEGVREAAERKAIMLDIGIDPSVGIVAGDQRRLRQSLDNILTNAVGYTDLGGKVSLRAVGDARGASITVTDNGRGIAAADRERVFDRFHRTAAAMGEGESALGLGLPLAKQFVEAHGGRIELQSELGAGTTVTILLPRQAEAEIAS
ncbi:PAS-domain containing protein [Allosphingosinicella flava]|uniref:histidine kinase n=1 Tax=Allosphingosinicella flava TaxID=2771430 RepID=A0A7T2LN51_9SPHN|nr:PAS domain-containing sensor histidine kinase [Sphingosinicella flava]QPQ56230.1 PAS-domain containing protein [Sphingosinicella flava]